ncbi:TetR/AcrR family transcriptional regulator [Spongiactinospora rosea]|uniref:TetR/AcrR family transcriptional regulator n=1 Tax=Spongiactinospora rosea TaxID=2248750 RepID=A0A366LQV8_9ACTN|nr:TetR/AcrR family transcriptional regulator [Spongiactinospora rosea]RBQ16010.1 TetR/AcrR family transcriptional regulator [Spongiactinospora rosea]
MAERSADRGRATRQRLLVAAGPLVGEVGWGGVTTRLVAERAGLAPGLVHYHFASVTDLLIAACTAHARTMLDETARRLTAHTDVAAGITWLLGELSRYTGADPSSLLLNEAFMAAARVPALRAELAGLLADFRAEVTGWLRRERPEADAEALAVLLAAVIDGIMLHRAVDPTTDLRALEEPLRLLFTGHA